MIGIDLNPAMCNKAQAYVAESGVQMECRAGRMEDIPVDDESVDVVISNGVSQSIVNDPKLWAY